LDSFYGNKDKQVTAHTNNLIIWDIDKTLQSLLLNELFDNSISEMNHENIIKNIGSPTISSHNKSHGQLINIWGHKRVGKTYTMLNLCHTSLRDQCDIIWIDLYDISSYLSCHGHINKVRNEIYIISNIMSQLQLLLNGVEFSFFYYFIKLKEFISSLLPNSVLVIDHFDQNILSYHSVNILIYLWNINRHQTKLNLILITRNPISTLHINNYENIFICPQNMTFNDSLGNHTSFGELSSSSISSLDTLDNIMNSTERSESTFEDKIMVNISIKIAPLSKDEIQKFVSTIRSCDAGIANLYAAIASGYPGYIPLLLHIPLKFIREAANILSVSKIKGSDKENNMRNSEGLLHIQNIIIPQQLLTDNLRQFYECFLPLIYYRTAFDESLAYHMTKGYCNDNYNVFNQHFQTLINFEYIIPIEHDRYLVKEKGLVNDIFITNEMQSELDMNRIISIWDKYYLYWAEKIIKINQRYVHSITSLYLMDYDLNRIHYDNLLFDCFCDNNELSDIYCTEFQMLNNNNNARKSSMLYTNDIDNEKLEARLKNQIIEEEEQIMHHKEHMISSIPKFTFESLIEIFSFGSFFKGDNNSITSNIYVDPNDYLKQQLQENESIKIDIIGRVYHRPSKMCKRAIAKLLAGNIGAIIRSRHASTHTGIYICNGLLKTLIEMSKYMEQSEESNYLLVNASMDLCNVLVEHSYFTETAEKLLKFVMEIETSDHVKFLQRCCPYNLGISIYNLARIYHQQSKLAEALELYKRSVSVIKHNLTSEHIMISNSQFYAAEILHSSFLFKPALALLTEALSIRKSIFGPVHLCIAEILSKIALIQEELQKFEECQKLYLEEIHIFNSIFGVYNIHSASEYVQLGKIFKLQLNWNEAYENFEKALVIQESILGKIHPQVARTMNMMANVLYEQGKYQEAYILYEKSLSIKKLTLGANHPNVATTLDNMGSVCIKFKLFAKALELYDQALLIRQSNFGSTHLEVAQSLHNKGMALDCLFRYDEAIEMYRKALAMKELFLDKNDPKVAQTLNNIGVVLFEEGKHSEAMAVYVRTLEMRRKFSTPSHSSDVSETLHNLGVLHETQGNYKEALIRYEEALILRRRNSGGNHSTAAETLCRIAGVFSALNQYREASKVYEEALAIYRFRYGSEHQDVATASLGAASMYEKLGDYDASISRYEDSISITRHIASDCSTNVDFANTLCSFANILWQSNQLHRALNLYQEALSIYLTHELQYVENIELAQHAINDITSSIQLNK
jgi:tetratricopeptide (TPR) repeat protein